MQIPKPGQKTIPLKDWRRFLRVADWFERTVEQGNGTRPPSYGQSLIVKTPEDGIDARDGTTISSATCIKCVAAETSTPGERTIHETDEELVVYNPENHDVLGEIFVKTTLSPNGTRYVDRDCDHRIQFKPNTDVPAFGVMYSTGIDATQATLVITTKKPDGLALGEIILINGPDAVDSGVIGKCHMAGDVPIEALVNGSETLAAGDVCGPKSSQWDLYGGYPGLIAFDVEDSDDLAWVQQYRHHHFWAKLDAKLSVGSSATAYLWWGSTLADSGENVTVHDNFLDTDTEIDSGALVEVRYFPICQKWYVMAAGCDDISDT